MAGTFKFYKDSGLTEEFVAGVDKLGPITSNSQDETIYIGSTEAGKKLQAKTNPGSDPIQVTINDAVPGSNLEASHIKLATGVVGNLDSAVAGEDLDLPAEILGGVVNAQPIHIRVEYPGSSVSDLTVSLQLSGDEVSV